MSGRSLVCLVEIFMLRKEINQMCEVAAEGQKYKILWTLRKNYGIVEDRQERDDVRQTQGRNWEKQICSCCRSKSVLELLYFAYCWRLERNSEFQHPCGAKQDMLPDAAKTRSCLMWVAELVTDTLLCYINVSLRNSCPGPHPACDTGRGLCRSPVYGHESKFYISIFRE